MFSSSLGGRWAQVGVGAEAGRLNLSLLVDQRSQRYQTREADVIDLLTFLHRYLPSSPSKGSLWAKSKQQPFLIDHLWLDNEGPEYPMLRKYFVGDGLRRAGWELCQLNVELHGPLNQYHFSHEQYDALMSDLFRNSSYLPITASDPINHVRMTFFNFRSLACLQRYIGSLSSCS